MRTSGVWLLIPLAWLLQGCASPNVNPSNPKPGMGYVDFYATEPLSWQIEELGAGTGEARKVFDDYTPLSILRVALLPGHHRLEVNLLNRITAEPTVAEVVVQDGMVTPVRISLVEMGETLVETRSIRVQGTYYGRYGRATRLRNEEANIYRIVAEPQPSVGYKVKSLMPYATDSALPPGTQK